MVNKFWQCLQNLWKSQAKTQPLSLFSVILMLLSKILILLILLLSQAGERGEAKNLTREPIEHITHNQTVEMQGQTLSSWTCTM